MGGCKLNLLRFHYVQCMVYIIKVARYSFSGSTPSKFDNKLRHHKQRFGRIKMRLLMIRVAMTLELS